MERIKQKIDRCFGITPFIKNKFSWIYFASLVITIVCMVLYAQQLDENYDLTYGAALYILILVDIGSNLMGEKTIWHEETRSERLLAEVFKINFMFIIPILSLNQFLKSDLTFSLLLIIMAVPIGYLLPFMRLYADKDCLYLRIIKINILLNLIVSIRTTFFGILAAVGVVFSWAIRNKAMNWTALIARSVTAYLVYVTLCIVAIPKCHLPVAKVDPCQPTSEVCNYFRNVYNCRY